VRDAYYADNRDIVKWGVLLHIAREFDLARILQVAYLRGSAWGDLEVDGQRVPLPHEVVAHFRDVRDVARMTDRPHIDVLAEPYGDREEYAQLVRERILERVPGEKRLVFLDPDTGLQPAHPKPEHVLESGLRATWDAMLPGDVLAFYQHQTNRDNEPWIEPKRVQFESALGLKPGTAKVAHGRTIARDVAFFYCAR